MTKEEVYKIYGITNDSLLNYEEIVDAYVENVTSELSYQNLNTENLEKIAGGFSYLHHIFYPEYKESIKNAEEIYGENHPNMSKMINLTANALLKVDDEMTYHTSHSLIKQLEHNLEKDYYARVEEPKKVKKLN